MIILYQNTVSAINFWRKTIRAMKLIAIFTFAVIVQLHAEVHSSRLISTNRIPQLSRCLSRSKKIASILFFIG
jgi:hypothetical protein